MTSLLFMKNLILIVGLAVISWTASAQRIALAGGASLQLPKKMLKASEASVRSLVKERYAAAESLTRLVGNNPGKIYMAGDILVFLNSAVIERDPKLLEKTKLASEDMEQQIKGFSQKIESIGDKRVLVVDHISEGIHLYRYTTMNEAGDLVVNGFVQYKPGQESTARAVLVGVINGISFKL